MTLTLSALRTEEILRYMGCPPEKADAVTRLAVEEAAAQVLAQAKPRWNWCVLGCTPEEAGVRLESGLLLPSQDLKRHLQDCTRVVLFCATLGTAVDSLIRRAGSGDMLRALAMDCAASEAVEEVCDQAEQLLAARFPDEYFCWRYSPGYGDLPLSLQGELLTLLDAPRRVGLTVSPSHILLPRKSVTAFLGISPHPPAPSSRNCLTCPGRDGCLYRKSGAHCGVS